MLCVSSINKGLASIWAIFGLPFLGMGLMLLTSVVRSTVCSVGTLLARSVSLHACSFCFANDILRSVSELERLEWPLLCFCFSDTSGVFFDTQSNMVMSQGGTFERMKEKVRQCVLLFYFLHWIQSTTLDYGLPNLRRYWKAALVLPVRYSMTCISKIPRLLLGCIHTWSQILRKTLFGTAGTDRMRVWPYSSAPIAQWHDTWLV